MLRTSTGPEGKHHMSRSNTIPTPIVHQVALESKSALAHERLAYDLTSEDGVVAGWKAMRPVQYKWERRLGEDDVVDTSAEVLLSYMLVAQPVPTAYLKTALDQGCKDIAKRHRTESIEALQEQLGDTLASAEYFEDDVCSGIDARKLLALIPQDILLLGARIVAQGLDSLSRAEQKKLRNWRSGSEKAKQVKASIALDTPERETHLEPPREGISMNPTYRYRSGVILGDMS